MARCIVTGGAGFIGSHVTDLLIEEGHEVVVIDNLSTGKLENINPGAEFIKADIEDEETFLGQTADYVFHLAALARIQPSIKDPVPPHNTNVNGTVNVLEFCRRMKAKLIFSGSSSIFSGEELPTNEEAAKDPKNPYALQKHVCEQYIHLYAKLYDLQYAILRYFNVYGERQITDGAYAAVVGIFLNQKAANKLLTITNDGEQRRDFTYVADVARANLMAMGWVGTFNIGAGKSYSINDIAEAIGGDKHYIGDVIGEVRNTLADNMRAKSLGWQPTMDIREWIANVKDQA